MAMFGINCGDCTQTAKTIAVLALIYVVLKKTQQYFRNKSTKEFYKKQYKKKRDILQSEIKTLEKKLEVNGVLLTDNRKNILSLSPTDLLSALKAKKFSAVDVLHAYQAKAIQVTRKLNCIVEFVQEAEGYAKMLDEMPDRNLPLHGLPVSIKAEFAMKNYDCLIGVAKAIGKPNEKDAVMVTALKRLGTVPFCRTNVPQILFSYGSENPVYGLTGNPVQLDRTAGGSSSGEGSLIGGGGSVLGLGSDIGGSLRIPAHFCGIASLKPTSQRLSSVGEPEIIPGVTGVRLSSGFMGKDVDIVTTAYKAIWNDNLLNDLHPLVLPIKWRSELYDMKRPLRIGVMHDYSILPATPGCVRAVRLAEDALKKAGHTVVPFSFTEDEMMSIHVGVGNTIMADNAHSLAKLLENEQVSSAAQGIALVNVIPEWIRRCLEYPGKLLISKRFTTTSASKSIDLMNTLGERDRLINAVLGRWREANIDVWLVPAFPFPAPKPDLPGFVLDATLYTASFNYLDFPAGIVPTTFESAEDQRQLEHYKHGGDVILKYVQKSIRGGEGLPICVQIVGQPWKEETVLRAMKELQDALREV